LRVIFASLEFIAAAGSFATMLVPILRQLRERPANQGKTTWSSI
jgi:hypothetical protein